MVKPSLVSICEAESHGDWSDIPIMEHSMSLFKTYLGRAHVKATFLGPCISTFLGLS